MNVESLEGFLRIGIVAGAGEGDGGLHILLRLPLDLCHLVFVENAFLTQTGAQDHQGITSLPARKFFIRTILEAVKERTFSMMAEAVSLGFNKSRSMSSAGTLDGLADHFIDRNGILPIDGDAWNIVGFSALGNIAHRYCFFRRNGDSIAVVFAQVDDRQFPDGGKIQPFVNGSFIGGAITEETEADAVGALHFRPQCRTGRDGNPGAENTGLTHTADTKVGKVHRATFAPVHTCALAKQLGHQPFQLRAFADGMTVRAMVADHVIVSAQRHAGPDNFALLTNTGMGRTRNLARSDHLDNVLFKASNAYHATIHLYKLFVCWFHISSFLLRLNVSLSLYRSARIAPPVRGYVPVVTAGCSVIFTPGHPRGN